MEPKANVAEPAAAFLSNQEKLCVLQALIAEGLDDLAAGRVSEWNLQDLLREARKQK